MGLLHIFMANNAYDLQRVTSPPPMDEISRLVAGVPEVVYVLYNGKRCQMFVNEDGSALDLPFNARATKIYHAWSEHQGKINPHPILGNAVLLDGMTMESSSCSED